MLLVMKYIPMCCINILPGKLKKKESKASLFGTTSLVSEITFILRFFLVGVF